MTRFYERPLYAVDTPMFCRCIPIKPIVLIMQLLAIIAVIDYHITSTTAQTTIVMFLEIVVLIFLVASFVAFLADYETFMHMHFCVVVVGLLIPSFFFVSELLSVIVFLISDQPAGNKSFSPLVLTASWLLATFFYIGLCHQLLSGLGRKYTLPTFRT